MTDKGKRKFLIVMNGEDSRGNVGGGTRITIEVAKVMQDKGYFNFMTLCSREGMLISRRCSFDNQFLIWGPGGYFGKNEIKNLLVSMFKPLILLWKNRKRIKQEVMVVWSQSDFLFDVFSGFFVKLMNKRVIWVASCYLVAPNPFKGYKFYWDKHSRLRFPDIRLISYWLAQRLSLFIIKFFADRLLLANNSDGQRISNLGINRNKMLVVGGGIEEARINNTPADKNVNFDAVYMGRMHPQKGILELVEIWKMVITKIPGAKLAIITVGENSYAKQVFKKIKDSGIEENIKIFGYMDFEQKYTFLKSCKLYITAEMYHDGGLAMLEAMACGLATITFKNPAIQAMIPCGRYEVPLNDLEAFSEAIIAFLKDDALRRKYSALAKAATRGWDWEERADLIYDFICNLKKI